MFHARLDNSKVDWEKEGESGNKKYCLSEKGARWLGEKDEEHVRKSDNGVIEHADNFKRYTKNPRVVTGNHCVTIKLEGANKRSS